MSALDRLCEAVNKKYNLKPNDVGSIEYHTDMCENAIVQLCNPHRGERQLITGDESTLKDYLNNILEGRIILNFWKVN